MEKRGNGVNINLKPPVGGKGITANVLCDVSLRFSLVKAVPWHHCDPPRNLRAAAHCDCSNEMILLASVVIRCKRCQHGGVVVVIEMLELVARSRKAAATNHTHFEMRFALI